MTPGPGIELGATLVERERSLHCTKPAPLKILLLCYFFMSMIDNTRLPFYWKTETYPHSKYTQQFFVDTQSSCASSGVAAVPSHRKHRRILFHRGIQFGVAKETHRRELTLITSINAHKCHREVSKSHLNKKTF